MNLSAFLGKWECEAALSSLKIHSLQRLSEEDIGPVKFFVVGSVLNDSHICYKSLLSPYWHHNSTGNTGRGSSKSIAARFPRLSGPSLDPTALSYDTYNQIPTAYMWALTRAWAEGKDPKDTAQKFLGFISYTKGMSSSIKRCCIVTDPQRIRV